MNPQERFSVPLTNWARSYKIDMQTMYQDRIAPIVPRLNGKGQYQAFSTELYNIDVSDVKPPKGAPNAIHYDSSLVSFSTEPYGLMLMVTDQERREALSPMDPIRQGIVTLRHALRLRKEYRLVTLAAATSNTSTPSFDWDDDSNATVVKDISDGKNSMDAALGWEPTAVLWGNHIGNEIVVQQDVKDMIVASAAFANRPASILNSLSGSDLPSPFMAMDLLQPNAKYNESEPGDTASYKNVWGDDAYLFYLDNSSMSPRWAVCIESLGMAIRQVRDDKVPGTWLVAHWEYQLKEATAAAIHRLIDVT